MASIGIAILLFSLYSLCEGAQHKNSSSHIRLGSSLSPETHPNSWPSASGLFEFGFYQQGSGFAVGIWLVGADHNTIVWTANRDDPPLVPSPNNTVQLQLSIDGKLVLTSTQGHEKLIASATNGSVSSASMNDSGNFVLYNEKHEVIWESFSHPTDTILGGQTLPVGGRLVSSFSDDDHSTERFQLSMQTDGNLVMYTLNTGIAYWFTNTAPKFKGVHLYLNATDGLLALIDPTNFEVNHIISSNGGERATNTTIYRATVGVNGVLRLYSHKMGANGTLQAPIIMWYRPQDPCAVNGVCGLNSYCTLNDDQPDCLCLPGSDYADLNRRTMGCLRNYSQPGCAAGGKENTSFYDMFTMENIDWEDNPDFEATMTMEQCNRSCLEDCNCGAALFDKDNRNCQKHKPPLRYVRRDLTTSTTAFFKVSKLTSTESKNNGSNLPFPAPMVVIRSKKVIVQILVLTLGLIIFSCVALAISGFYIFKIRVLRYKRLTEINGNLGLADEELTLRVFSYNEMKRATNGFKQELGKGSFGAVYKGALNKGKKLIAVKRLEKLVEEGEREFRAEMQSIGRTHHKNLVRLLGYSAEGSKRLLVYEYMSNGSLADLLFKAQWHPAWDERVRIAVDVARGLLYLHEECKSPIIHCDIKPQNILMDEFWNAKISDFGLAKLLLPDQTRTFTGIRGTRGYLAPEWQKNTPISVKADVYSFGIVLLELLCCRRNLDVTVRDEEIILSTWVYKCFVSRELHKLIVGGEEVNKKSLENMVKVGLWCIQDEPALRPSMKSVVLMLQGITDISIPPCPTTMSM